MVPIALTSASLPTKKRILTVCVKLFLEQGYKKTTVAQIIKKAGVSNSSFQNIFRAKDGVLTELTKFMFGSQFGTARRAIDGKLPPAYVYAVETAIQLTLTEINENIREIYIEAYTQKEASQYISEQMSKELYRIFSQYQPQLTIDDFWAMDIGTTGIMRNYMAYPCDDDFTLERKIHSFLTLSLRCYKVPEEEIEGILQFIDDLDIRAVAEQVMHTLFKELQMHFKFTLSSSSLTVRM